MAANETNFDLDDPRLTAYALGDLDGDERLQMEAWVACHPEAQRAVAEIRAAAGELTEALAAEPAPALRDEQRAAIEAKLQGKVIPGPGSASGWSRRRTFTSVFLMAASMLIFVGFYELSKSPRMTLRSSLALEDASPGSDDRRAAKPAGGVLSDDLAAASAKKPGSAPDSGEVTKSEGDVGYRWSDHLEAENAIPGDAKLRAGLAAEPGAGNAPAPSVLIPESTSGLAKKDASSLTGASTQQELKSAESITARFSSESEGDRKQQKLDQAGSAGDQDGGTKKGEAIVETLRFDSLFEGDIPAEKRKAEAKSELYYVAPVAGGSGGGGAAPRDRSKDTFGGRTGGTRGISAPGGKNGAAPSPPGTKEVPVAGRPVGPSGPSGPATPAVGPAGPASPSPTAGATGAQPSGSLLTPGGFRGAPPAIPPAGLFTDPAPKPAGGAPVPPPTDSVERQFGVLNKVGYLGEATKDKSTDTESKDFSESNQLALAARVRRLDDERSMGMWRDRIVGTETYTPIVENSFLRSADAPLSTFGLDVDTASYANVRRFLQSGQLPPRDAVRLEEMINYFRYSYAPPKGNVPFSTALDVAACPWQPSHRLVRVGIKAREVDVETRKPSNLVFLVDVSGSMQPDDRLPLVKQGLRLLTKELGENDNIGIVTYAGTSGVALPSTNGSRAAEILSVVESLSAGGSTNGASGIQLAYEMAQRHFITGGVNRVILATDGDFNVGTTSPDELEKLIAEKAKSGVFLTVLGVGRGNLKDATMERLADRGNGNFSYLDSLREARRVLVEQMHGTLVTVAKDVKVQVEFNPTKVAAYRLLGYENRTMAAEDFRNDAKDAGDIGAGHTVTALYEVVPVGAALTSAEEDRAPVKLKYAAPVREEYKAAEPKVGGELSNELLTLFVRYKQPEGEKAEELEIPLKDSAAQSIEKADIDFRFQASVAAFGMLLRGSRHSGSATLDWVLSTAEASKGEDRDGWRREFIDLVMRAKSIR